MKTIIFKTTEYELVSEINRTASCFQASIAKEGVSIDELLTELSDVETITVKEDGEVIGVYSGYSKFLAVTIHDDISVELLNEDIQAQIDALSGEVQEQETAIENLDKKVDDAVNTLGDKAEAADILLGNE